jgi:hypothetical protein
MIAYLCAVQRRPCLRNATMISGRSAFTLFRLLLEIDDVKPEL